MRWFGDSRRDAQTLNSFIQFSDGDPNGENIASPGAICLSEVGGAGATLWVKESGNGNTGWVAK